MPLAEEIHADFVEHSFAEIVKRIPAADLEETRYLPASAYNPIRRRYRADSLIAWLHGMALPGQILVGITNVDISTTKDSMVDWGVMGLGFRPGNACIVSDHRLKDKGSFWKIALHELGHTAGLDHCPVKRCLMRDAEGHDPTGEETDFCESCKSYLIQKGWVIKGL